MIRTQRLHKNGRVGHSFYVVKEIAELIPPGAQFVPELTDDGVLFRFVGLEADKAHVSAVPEWAKGADNGR